MNKKETAASKILQAAPLNVLDLATLVRDALLLHREYF